MRALSCVLLNLRALFVFCGCHGQLEYGILYAASCLSQFATEYRGIFVKVLLFFSDPTVRHLGMVREGGPDNFFRPTIITPPYPLRFHELVGTSRNWVVYSDATCWHRG
jgi:hypothetical protein